MSYETREFLVMLSVIAGVFLVILGSTFSMMFGASYIDCRSFGQVTGHNVRYAWGCYVEVDGKFVPREYVYGSAHELRHK